MILLCLGGASAASAEECEPAVDVADSLNVNASTDCNYEDSGLNGAVRRWFKRDQSSSAASSQAAKSDSQASIKVSPPVNGADALAEARYGLLSAISQECIQGFRITDELYLPANGELTLRLVYQCL